MRFWRTKSVADLLAERTGEGKGGFRKNLTAVDLTLLGIGAIIGTGLFVLTGVAAARYAGPGVVLSFVLAGLAAAFAALVYAELAAMVPVAGSAYTYSYAALGELPAWIIGWDLILEYTVASGAVAVGWSGYMVNLLSVLGVALPSWATAPPGAGGLVNIPAILVVLVIGGLLVLGTRESATANAVIVLVKLLAVLLFIAIGVTRVKPEFWTPLLPFGPEGVIRGAAIIFFAYIGFDAVSTAAEEVRKPGRDLPLGILGSLMIASLLYVAVAGILTGMVRYTELNTPSPLAFALIRAGAPLASGMIAVGGLAGLTSVILVNIFGQSRVFFAMARDGLLPPVFSRLHARFRTPYVNTLLTTGVVALIAGFLPVATVAEMANIGTLAAFVLVSVGIIVLRRTRPELKRPFRTPFFPLVPVLAMGSALYLMVNLPLLTWIRFLVWLTAGLTIYFLYGQFHSRLARGPQRSNRR